MSSNRWLRINFPFTLRFEGGFDWRNSLKHTLHGIWYFFFGLFALSLDCFESEVQIDLLRPCRTFVHSIESASVSAFMKNKFLRVQRHCEVVHLEYFLQIFPEHFNLGLLVDRKLHENDNVSRQSFHNLLTSKDQQKFKENSPTYCENETRVEIKQVASSKLDLPVEQLHGQLSQLNLERLVFRRV